MLATLVAEGGDPAAIVEREGLAQISDSGELEAIVAAAVEANPEAAEQIRAGNEKAIGAIVGAVMKETKGRADGGEVNRLIMEQLEPEPSSEPRTSVGEWEVSEKCVPSTL